MTPFLTFLKLLTALLVMAFGIFAYIKNKNSNVNHAFLKLTCAIALWVVFFSVAANSNEKIFALKMYKFGYCGVIFIPILFYEFIVCFLKGARSVSVVKILYGVGFAFILLLATTSRLVDGLYVYNWGFYPKVNKFFHPLFLIFFFSLFTAAFIFLVLNYIKFKKDKSRIQLARIKYVFWGSIIASLASVDFIANYSVSVYPFGFIFMVPFPLIFAYAIVRYRLMDVSLAITRTSLFVGVYSIVLGIPFAIVFFWKENLINNFGGSWWMFPLLSSTILATAGPFIFLFIQRKAENKLFQEQKRYQSTLRQASIGMGRIKELSRLVNLIVHIVTRTVRLEHTLIYLDNQSKSQFELGAFRSRKIRFKFKDFIYKDSVLVKKLIQFKNPILFEEIQERTKDYGDLQLAHLEKELSDLDGALVVPSFIDEKLLAIIVLGNKTSGKPFTDDDLAVFSILANQAALAIENALFYEDMKKTHEQLFKAEKMATIGTMADGLSHQINNRLHALGFIAGDVLDTIKLKKNLPMSDELREVMVDIEHALARVQDNVSQGGEIVRGLLKYTRKGEEGFAKVDLDKLIDAAIEMTQFKIKPGELRILREFDGDLPRIKGNFTQLQEVFFNLIDNAYDAMMEKKREKIDKDYIPTITFSAHGDNAHVNIIVSDNGVGIKSEDKNKLFTPFFTTKLSSKKGTGLGLYVIQKLIEENHGGKVYYKSKHNKGTNVYIELPIYN